MKKYFFILLIIFPICGNAAKTTYGDDGVFETVSKTRVNVSLQRADTLLSKFIDDLTNDPESLFDNIFEGLGRQEDGKSDIFIIEYRGYNYDPKQDIYTGTLDILMVGIRLFGISFSGRITQKYTPDKYREVRLELVESNSIVKLADGNIVVRKIDEQTVEIRQTAHFKFTWFFDQFFTLNNYKKVAEWRLDRFLMNLKREMEAPNQ